MKKLCQASQIAINIGFLFTASIVSSATPSGDVVITPGNSFTFPFSATYSSIAYVDGIARENWGSDVYLKEGEHQLIICASLAAGLKAYGVVNFFTKSGKRYVVTVKEEKVGSKQWEPIAIFKDNDKVVQKSPLKMIRVRESDTYTVMKELLRKVAEDCASSAQKNRRVEQVPTTSNTGDSVGTGVQGVTH